MQSPLRSLFVEGESLPEAVLPYDVGSSLSHTHAATQAQIAAQPLQPNLPFNQAAPQAAFPYLGAQGVPSAQSAPSTPGFTNAPGAQDVPSDLGLPAPNQFAYSAPARPAYGMERMDASTRQELDGLIKSAPVKRSNLFAYNAPKPQAGQMAVASGNTGSLGSTQVAAAPANTSAQIAMAQTAAASTAATTTINVEEVTRAALPVAQAAVATDAVPASTTVPTSSVGATSASATVVTSSSAGGAPAQALEQSELTSLAGPVKSSRRFSDAGSSEHFSATWEHMLSPSAAQSTDQSNAQAAASVETHAVPNLKLGVIQASNQGMPTITLPQVKTNPIDQQLDRLPRYGSLSARPPVEQQGAIAAQVQGLAGAQVQTSDPSSSVAQSSLPAEDVKHLLESLSLGKQAAYAQFDIITKKLGYSQEQYDSTKQLLDLLLSSEQQVEQSRRDLALAQSREISARQNFEASAQQQQRQAAYYAAQHEAQQRQQAQAQSQSQLQAWNQPQPMAGKQPWQAEPAWDTYAPKEMMPESWSQFLEPVVEASYAQQPQPRFENSSFPGYMPNAPYAQGQGQVQMPQQGQFADPKQGGSSFTGSRANMAYGNQSGSVYPRRKPYVNPTFNAQVNMLPEQIAGQAQVQAPAQFKPQMPAQFRGQAFAVPEVYPEPCYTPQGFIEPQGRPCADPSLHPDYMQPQAQMQAQRQRLPQPQTYGQYEQYAPFPGQPQPGTYGAPYSNGFATDQAPYAPQGMGGQQFPPPRQGGQPYQLQQNWQHSNAGQGEQAQRGPFHEQYPSPVDDFAANPYPKGDVYARDVLDDFGPVDLDPYAYPEYQKGGVQAFGGAGHGPQGGYGEGFNLPSRQQRAQAAAFQATQEALASQHSEALPEDNPKSQSWETQLGKSASALDPARIQVQLNSVARGDVFQGSTGSGNAVAQSAQGSVGTLQTNAVGQDSQGTNRSLAPNLISSAPIAVDAVDSGVYTGRKSNLPEQIYNADDLQQAVTQAVNLHVPLIMQVQQRSPAQTQRELAQRDYYFELMKNTADYVYDMHDALSKLCEDPHHKDAENKQIDSILESLPDTMMRAKENQLKQQSTQGKNELGYAKPALQSAVGGASASANATQTALQTQSQGTNADMGAASAAIASRGAASTGNADNFTLSQQGAGGIDVNDPRYLGAQLIGSVSLKDGGATLKLQDELLPGAQATVNASGSTGIRTAQGTGSAVGSLEGSNAASASATVSTPEDLAHTTSGFNPHKAQTTAAPHLQNSVVPEVGKAEQLLEQAQIQAMNQGVVESTGQTQTANLSTQLVSGSVGIAMQAQSSLNSLVQSMKQQEGHGEFNVDDVFGSTLGDNLDITQASAAVQVPTLAQPGGKSPSQEELPPWEIRSSNLQQGNLTPSAGANLTLDAASGAANTVTSLAPTAADYAEYQLVNGVGGPSGPGGATMQGSTLNPAVGTESQVAASGFLPAQAKLPAVPEQAQPKIEPVASAVVDRCGVNLEQIASAGPAVSTVSGVGGGAAPSGVGIGTMQLRPNASPLEKKPILDSFDALDAMDRQYTSEVENQIVYAPSPWELAAQASVVQVGDQDINVEHVKVNAPVPLNRHSQIGSLHQDMLEPPLFTGFMDSAFGTECNISQLQQIVEAYQAEMQYLAMQRQNQAQRLIKLKEIYPNLGQLSYTYQLIVAEFNSKLLAELRQKPEAQLATQVAQAAKTAQAFPAVPGVSSVLPNGITPSSQPGQTSVGPASAGQVSVAQAVPGGVAYNFEPTPAAPQGANGYTQPAFAAVRSDETVAPGVAGTPGVFQGVSAGGATGSATSTSAGSAFQDAISGPSETSVEDSYNDASWNEPDDDYDEDPSQHYNKTAYMNALVDLDRAAEEDDDFSERHSFTDMELDISSFGRETEPEIDPDLVAEMNEAHDKSLEEERLPLEDGDPTEGGNLASNQLYHAVVNIPGMRLLNQEDYLQMLASQDPWYNLIVSAFPDRGLYYGLLVNVERQIDPNDPNHWTLLVDKEQDLSSVTPSFWKEVQDKMEAYLNQKLKFEIVQLNEPSPNCPVAAADKLEKELIEKERHNIAQLAGLDELLHLLNENFTQVGIELYTKVAAVYLDGDANASANASNTAKSENSKS